MIRTSSPPCTQDSSASDEESTNACKLAKLDGKPITFLLVKHNFKYFLKLISDLAKKGAQSNANVLKTDTAPFESKSATDVAQTDAAPASPIKEEESKLIEVALSTNPTNAASNLKPTYAGVVKEVGLGLVLVDKSTETDTDTVLSSTPFGTTVQSDTEFNPVVGAERMQK
jgi:hypothetical protein